MTNKFKNECDVELNGVTYKLRGTFEALHNIEQRTNKSVTILARDLSSQKISLLETFVIFYEGIKGAGDDVDEDELKEAILEAGTFNSILATTDFFAVALYGGKALEDANKKK